MDKKTLKEKFTLFGSARNQKKARDSFCYLLIHGEGRIRDVACQTAPLGASRRQSIVERSHVFLSGADLSLAYLLPRPSATGPRPTATFRMECSVDGDEAMYRYRYLFSCKAALVSAARSLSPGTHPQHLAHIATILRMGRRPWATPDQLEYLKSWLPHLPRAKETIGLQTLYKQVYEGFIVKWQPDPAVPVPGMSSEQLADKAKDILRDVRAQLSTSTSPFYSQSASVSSTGSRKNERKRNSPPFPDPGQILASLTCPANRSAKNLPTNSTKRTPSSTGGHRIPHSDARFRTFGTGGARIPYGRL